VASLCCLALAAVVDVSVSATFAQTEPRRSPAPRPVAVWSPGPLDVVAAFDTKVDSGRLTDLVGKTISYFEVERRPDNRAATRPLGSLRIAGARLTDDGRTLFLATDPHPRMARYVLPLAPTEGRVARDHPVDAAGSYDLSGVEVAWNQQGDTDDRPRWTGWWPVLDVEATRRLTHGSRPHEDGLALLSKPGRLVLGTLVRLPKGSLTLRVDATGPIDEAILGDVQAEVTAPAPADLAHHAQLEVQSQGDPLFLTITIQTGTNGRPFSLKASYRLGAKHADHPLTREQLILPWVPLPATGATAPLVVPDLSGGDLVRGQVIYSGEQARCAQCHTFRGQGGKVGPDLTEIGKKGRAEIYRAIAAPSALIDPEFISYSVASRDGRVVVGLVRAEGADAIRITDTNARATLIARKDIEQIRPSANSIMPVGLTGTLGDAAVRDLIAFLTSEPTRVPSSQRSVRRDPVRAPDVSP
jgi:putative heme-binding domain-containing protein